MSGADLALLRSCENLSGTERLRFTGQGALVLIPAVLGMIAMSYAMSTLVPQPMVFLLAGLLWGVIVGIIDWYIVATSHKTQLPVTAGRRIGKVIAVLVRLAFAGLVGFVVAHPLVMLCFGGSISETMETNRRAAVTARQTQGQEEIAAVPEALVTVTGLQEQRVKAKEFHDCLTALQLDEQSGRGQASRPCGSTSGQESCGPRCQNIGTRIKEAGNEVAILDGRIAEAKSVDAAALNRYDNAVKAIKDEEARVISDIEASFSRDYLARVAALQQLKERSTHVGIVEAFLVLLFFVVDILPLTMKLLTPVGEYEMLRDTKLAKASATRDAEVQVLGSGRVQQAAAAARANADLVCTEIDEIRRVPLKILTDRFETIQAFDQLAERLRRASTTPEAAESVEREIAQLRVLDTRASQKIFERGDGFIQGT